MNPTFRTVALIAASLGLVVSLFVALRDDDDRGAETAAATTSATTETAETTTETATTTEPAATTTEPPATTTEPPATTQPPATTAPDDRVITIDIDVVGGQPEGGIARPSVRKDRDVVLRVRSDVADHVHLHGYDLLTDVAPGTVGQIRFKATIPGRFEIELEDRGVVIADLEVRP